MASNPTIAIIVAAGRGSRAGDGGPKQYRDLQGQSVLFRTVTAFIFHDKVDAVRVIIHRDDEDLYHKAMASILDNAKLLSPVHGGLERQDSVRLGLESLEAKNPKTVLIHDAARPFVDAPTIDRVLANITPDSGAIAALPVFDTLKKATEHTGKNESSIIGQTVPRDGLWRAQTPQGFGYLKILEAHQKCAGTQFTDDAAVAEAYGIQVELVSGSPDNMKITQAEDFGMATLLLDRKNQQGYAMDEFRTGHGYDVHAVEPGNNVVLCGINIDHDRALKGHSDADVGMHALTDAILGAISEGDIGDHFPPTEPQWKGVASKVFLTKARDLVFDKQGQITHCDVTLICEAPKIGPHRSAMRNALAEILKISVNRISVKATTTEQLGFTGRREGIAALATATIKLPSTNN